MSIWYLSPKGLIKKEKKEIMNKKNDKKNQPQREMKKRQEEKDYDDQVEGRNSVLELLESEKDINKIFIAKGERHGSINKIIAIAKEKGIIIVEKDKRQMDEMAQEENYQGVIVIVPPFVFYLFLLLLFFFLLLFLKFCL